MRTGAISGGQAVTGTAIIIIITYYYLHQNIDTGTDAAQITLVITSDKYECRWAFINDEKTVQV